jgi:hypothetical protein
MFQDRFKGIDVRRWVSKGVEEGPEAACSAGVSGVARPQGVERLGMAGLGETLGSPRSPLAIRPCSRATMEIAIS